MEIANKIKDIQHKINNEYDLELSDLREIENMSNGTVDIIYNSFLLGYEHGVQAQANNKAYINKQERED